MNSLLNEMREDRPDHHFHTAIPNIISELGLTIYDREVYRHIKQVAGDSGKCWQSNKTMAAKIGISERQLRYSLETLSKVFPLLNSSLIKIFERKKPDGSQESNLIYIVDIWRVNGDFFRKDIPSWDKGGGAPCAGGGVHHMQGGGAPYAPKEEHSKKNTVYKKTMSKSAVENVDRHEKKTMSSDKSKKKDNVSIHKRWGLKADQAITYDWLASFSGLSDEDTLAYWSKTYSLERLQSVHRQATSKKAKNVGGYMNKLLKMQAVVPNDDIEQNKSIADEFIKENNWKGCRLDNKYFVFPIGLNTKDIPLFLPPFEFMQQIARAYLETH